MVVQIIRVEPPTIYSPNDAALFRSCPDQVEVGWLDDGQRFYPPVSPEEITL